VIDVISSLGELLSRVEAKVAKPLFSCRRRGCTGVESSFHLASLTGKRKSGRKESVELASALGCKAVVCRLDVLSVMEDSYVRSGPKCEEPDQKGRANPDDAWKSAQH